MPADTRADNVLETLLLPIAEQRVLWPEAVAGLHTALFLRARDGESLRAAPRPGLLCEQSFKPDADALQRAGYAMRESESVSDAAVYPLVLLLPPRQRDEARALMARAVRATRPGGRVLACIANTEGARSGEADLARLVGPVSTLTKNKCRAFWSAPLGAPPQSGDVDHPRVDHSLVEAWLTLDKLRPVHDGQFVSRPGLFAWDRIDPATALLAAQLPTDLNGRVADLGAGHGLLTALMLARCPKVKAVDLFEAEARALDAARINLAAFNAPNGDEPDAGQRVPLTFHWHDVTAGLPRSFDNIVSNPPFHNVSRAALPEVGQRFIAVAAGALRPGGSMWLVANRHLPYEAVLKERFGLVKTAAEGNGYKVIEAVKTVRKRT